MEAWLDGAKNIVTGAGPFFWPLLICSIAAAWIVGERFFALRPARILPDGTVQALLRGEQPALADDSPLGTIARYAGDPMHDEEAVRSFARLELNRMERGFVFLEILVGVAPMVGLMGTVVALIRVFGGIDVATGAAEQAALTKGISLALSTTVLGLGVAIPTLFCSSLLQRRVETYAVRIDTLLQHYLARRNRGLRAAAAAAGTPSAAP